MKQVSFFINKSQERARGFTLIELLVTIAIIGILASVVFASLNESRKKARDSRRLSEIKDIGLAAERYYQEDLNFVFPDTLDQLAPYFPDSSYKKDPQGNDYVYKKQTSPKAFCVGAKMETSRFTNTCATECSSIDVSAFDPGINYCIKGP